MKKDLGFKVVSFVDLFLLLVSIYANIQGIINDNNAIQYIFNLLAVVFAISYCMIGYKKNGNLYFRLFSAFLALKEMAAITWVGVNEEVPAFTFILMLICFACALIIAVAKDLGKKLSYVLVIAYIMVSIFTLTYVLMNTVYFCVVTYNATRLLLALVLGVMIYAKYQDKKDRNTK